MNTRTKPFRTSLRALLCGAFVLTTLTTLHAGSATWNLNPITGDWNTAANWTPETVPNGSTDTASFGTSNLTNVALSAATEISQITFDSGASSYTITAGKGSNLTISGVGVVNNSGIMQNFVTVPDRINVAYILFTNNATAGSMVTYTNTPHIGETVFDDNSNAGSATFIAEGGNIGADAIGGAVVFEDDSDAANATVIALGGTTPNSNGGEIAFLRNASAGNATFINNPATANRAQGGFVEFIEDTATAASATFINNGSNLPEAQGGITDFQNGHAANATFIANGGGNGGQGGQIWLKNTIPGDIPRIEVFGNGTLSLSSSIGAPSITIGSIEGDGLVLIGAYDTVVGGNNLNTIFNGTIMDDQFSGGGQVRKTGSGTWIVTGANTYRGGTKVLQGRLEVSNRLGSGTGTGPVLVRHGGLGGRGIIGGPVTVGDGTTRGAVLNPGRTATQPQTLTITNILTLNSNASYSCALNSNTASADQVAANGVTINEGALVALGDSGGTALLPGTAFTIINNTGITAIFGTFINLPDGGTITIGSNTFQANYEGGDGNDLTLTVVQ